MEHTLQVEGRVTEQDPRFDLIAESIQQINLRGPSFLVLTNQSGSYVQAAGARLRLTVEYRQVTPFGFRHFVLGRSPEQTKEVGINYTGGTIRVMANEVLTVRDAVDVFRSFHESGTAPPAFVRRETTDRFQSHQ
jgi:hypothetical protein